jgi:Icc-related predicted phosphoesterase
MVRGVFTADQHGNIDQVVRAVRYARDVGAILILGGDITPQAQYTTIDGIKRQRDFLERYLPLALEPLEGRVYLMMGNEDCKCNADVLDAWPSRWHPLHKKRWPLGSGIDIVGYSCVPCTPYPLKDWERIDHDPALVRKSRMAGKVTHNGAWYPACVPSARTIAEDLAEEVYAPNGGKMIFVSHCPPYNTLVDVAKGENHFGSKAIRDYIERHKPLLTLHGHMHECFSIKHWHMEKVGESWVVGAGNFPAGDEVALIDFDTDRPYDALRITLPTGNLP